MRIAVLATMAVLAAVVLMLTGFPSDAAGARLRVRYTPLLTAGMDISCNAEQQSVCDGEGCRAEADGMTHVAVSYEGATGHGSFCIGEGCSAMTLAAMPASTASSGPDGDIVGAIVVTHAPEGQRAIAAPFFDGVLTIKRDGSSFRLHRGDSVWTGACDRAVHE
jgi:hypothetical protein